MVKLVNRAKVTTLTTGTGTLTLGPAVDGFQSFAAAGVSSGDQVRYVIEDGDAWEIGLGSYSSAGPSLSRNPSESSAGGAVIALSGEALVYITAAAHDIIRPGDNVSSLINDVGYTANTGTVTSVAAVAGSGISISGASITGAGTIIIANTAPHQATNLSLTGTGNARILTSSTGSNASLPVATTSNAGLMATGDKSKLDGIEAGAQVNAVTSVATRTGAVTLNKLDIGLGDVDNTSDASKPISTAVQTALNGKVEISDNRLTNPREWTATTISQTEAEAGTATTRRAFTAQRVRQAIFGWWNGSADKTKLDGIQAGAQVNVATNIGYTAAASAGTLTSSTGANATLPAATTLAAGLLSSVDKTKLDGVDVGAQVNVATNLSITAGTTAGPTINSSTGANATLPVAGASASGVVTTGSQTFAGLKTFSSTISASISGNAGTATTLQTARSINGTSFNGASNITTASWGIARTLTIGATGKSINGSGNVSWSLAEIGAAAAAHTHTLASLTDTSIASPAIGDILYFNSVAFVNVDPDTAGLVAKSGTQIIAGAKTFSGAVILGQAGTATNNAVRADRTITAGTGLTGGGNLTANRTINAVTLTQSQAESPTSTIVGQVSGQLLAQAITKRITVSTANPSGGVDGDIWFKVT